MPDYVSPFKPIGHEDACHGEQAAPLPKRDPQTPNRSMLTYDLVTMANEMNTYWTGDGDENGMSYAAADALAIRIANKAYQILRETRSDLREASRPDAPTPAGVRVMLGLDSPEGAELDARIEAGRKVYRDDIMENGQ